MWDVGVIGGGPAGSTAARLMAQQGLGVLLLEAAEHPRTKPCGGALTDRGLEFLPAGYEPLLYNHPNAWTFRAAGISPVTVTRAKAYCHTVVRREFDRFLFEEAARAGAAARDGERVTAVEGGEGGAPFTLVTTRGRHQVRYLVGADGAKGVSARAIGIARPRAGAGLEVEEPAPDALAAAYRDRCEVMVSGTPWGYCWVIPKGPALNVGVGSFHASGFAWKARLLHYLEEIGFPGLPTVLAHPLPYRWSRTRLSKGRALVVGDAAGLMDPFSAEGIYSALSSAALAARVVTDAAPRGQTLDGYDAALRDSVWPELERAGALARLFYTMPGTWGRAFASDTTLLTTYLDVLDNKSGYDRLFRATRERWWRLVRRAPPTTAS